MLLNFKSFVSIQIIGEWQKLQPIRKIIDQIYFFDVDGNIMISINLRLRNLWRFLICHMFYTFLFL